MPSTEISLLEAGRRRLGYVKVHSAGAQRIGDVQRKATSSSSDFVRFSDHEFRRGKRIDLIDRSDCSLPSLESLKLPIGKLVDAYSCHSQRKFKEPEGIPSSLCARNFRLLSASVMRIMLGLGPEIGARDKSGFRPMTLNQLLHPRVGKLNCMRSSFNVYRT